MCAPPGLAIVLGETCTQHDIPESSAAFRNSMSDMQGFFSTVVAGKFTKPQGLKCSNYRDRQMRETEKSPRTSCQLQQKLFLEIPPPQLFKLTQRARAAPSVMQQTKSSALEPLSPKDTVRGCPLRKSFCAIDSIASTAGKPDLRYRSGRGGAGSCKDCSDLRVPFQASDEANGAEVKGVTGFGSKPSTKEEERARL